MGSLHVSKFILSGQVYEFDLTFMGGDIFQNVTLDSCFAQIPDVMWPTNKYENNPMPSPPATYNSAIAWITIIPSDGATAPATVTVSALELRQKLNGTDSLAFSSFIDHSTLWGLRMPIKYYKTRSAWCEPADDTCQGTHLASGVDYSINGNSVVLTIQPGYIYHFWNTIQNATSPYWHYPTTAGAQYYARSVATINGSALFSLGIDYWNETTNKTDEAANSFWACAGTGSQEIKAGAYR